MNTRLVMPAFALTTLVLTGCVANSDGTAGTTIAVASSDSACALDTATAHAGTVTFSIRNDGTDVTEFYLYADDGTTVIAEVENIGPALTRDAVAQLGAGRYIAACKPGMQGDGIRVDFTVTGEASPVVASQHAEALNRASEEYLDYVRAQVATLVMKTDEFAAAFTSRDDVAARDLYPRARAYWESIEPVAESFGDLDPAIDAREADLADGDEWTGWHRAEKALWPPIGGGPMDVADRGVLMARLVADTALLAERVNDPGFVIEAFQIGNGAKELLDEVAAGKITGEEEVWSHTDLWDFRANLDGAAKAFEVLRPTIAVKQPGLATELDARFDEVDVLLSTYGSLASGFVAYDSLSQDAVRDLARAVDALAEPLSRLTATAIS